MRRLNALDELCQRLAVDKVKRFAVGKRSRVIGEVAGCHEDRALGLLAHHDTVQLSNE